jgi:hypothetical protein
MLSEPDRDMEKLGGDHRTRRTAAIASLNVGWCLLYQAQLEQGSPDFGFGSSVSC